MNTKQAFNIARNAAKMDLLMELDPHFLVEFIKGEREILGFTMDDLMGIRDFLRRNKCTIEDLLKHSVLSSPEILEHGIC